MSERSAHHTTFTIEREYPVPVAKAYAAWSQPDAKARWFCGPSGQWTLVKREFDFRPGGVEHVVGKFKAGKVSDFRCRYSDIVPEKRIVYSYEMFVNDKRISVSLATVEFAPKGKGTQLIFTEQAVHLDGYPTPEDREQGTRGLLDRLGESLGQANAGRGTGTGVVLEFPVNIASDCG